MDSLEFHQIVSILTEAAHCGGAKKRLSSLSPMTNLTQCRQAIDETTAARKILDACGSPPLTGMDEAERAVTLAAAGAMLSAAELETVARFASSLERLRKYLASAEDTGVPLAQAGRGIADLNGLRGEIERCVRAGNVDFNASAALKELRRHIESATVQIQSRLNACLSRHAKLLSDSMIVVRNGRYALPVKRQYRNEFPGAVVDLSASGSTVFMEPNAVGKLSQELHQLEIAQDNEVRRILYTLSALVADEEAAIRRSMEAVEALDFIFAKAQVSRQMDAVPPEITQEREIRLRNGRHPMLDKAKCVPLSLELNAKVRGVIVTGANTGGKTVALKTAGLLSLMAQCGLHVPAAEGTRLCLFDKYLLDIGDGQNIQENLSTFSAHLTRIKEILASATSDSLVLMDELGSGTDPQEGMGLAVAVLDELRKRGCMVVATTHYPEVKAYCEKAPGFINARMRFDDETLSPTYQLEVGLAGRSCALAIARRIGLPEHVLAQALLAAQGRFTACENTPPAISPSVFAKDKKPAPLSAHAQSFVRGDCVILYPTREIGIIAKTADANGMLCVQVKKEKRLVNHKRLKRIAPAEEMYPEGYDFSIVFDSVANRKARHTLERRYDSRAEVRYEE